MNPASPEKPPAGATAPINVVFTLTAPELAAARLAFHRLHYRTPQRIILKATVVIIGLGFALFFRRPSGWLMATVGVGLFWFDELLIPLIARWNYRIDATLRCETRLSISAEAVRVSSAIAESTIQWKFFSRYHENERFFLLVGEGRRMLILLKRCIAVSDMPRLADILTAAGLRPLPNSGGE